MNEYKDIMYLDRPKSSRPKMSLHDRAAQFAPFAALAGYDEEVKETARLVDQRIILDEESYRLLDTKLELLKEHLKEEFNVTVMYFEKDLLKVGGSYQMKSGVVKKIDVDKRALVFEDKQVIEIEDIFSLTLPEQYESMC